MPYESIRDLPSPVREYLPEHAQEIYRAAYNSTWDFLQDEGRAHQVAWAAVKHKYEKDNKSGKWKAKTPAGV
jgi:cation transport regulator